MTVKLLFAGDVAITGDHKKGLLDAELLKLASNHDIFCCNFEAAIISESSRGILKTGPTISQQSKAIGLLKDSGVNMVSLANNHIMDYGLEGLSNTKRLLKDFETIGADENYNKAYEPIIKNINGTLVAFISVAERGYGCAVDNRGGYAYVYDKKTFETIKNVRPKVDIVILNIHAGLEDIHIPLPEWRTLYKLLINLGVDVIIGHHPHLIQGLEKYNSSFILYSLGNFAFDNQDIDAEDNWFKSCIASITIEDKKVKMVEMIPIKYTNSDRVFLNDSDYDFKRIFEFSSSILLDEDKYIYEINQLCDKFYKDIYYQYYLNVYGLSNVSGLKSKIINIRNLIRKNFKNEIDINFLYHNIAIESHRYVCIRALSNQIYSEQMRRG